MTPSFVIPAAGNGSPESVSRKRRMAEAMLAQSMGAEPISSPWQGAAKLAQALMGGLATARADSTEKQGREAANQALIRALTGGQTVHQGADPIGALVEGANNPWQSEMGQKMLWDKYQRDNTPYQPDWKTFNQGNDVYRYDQNDPNAKPALFFDGPEPPPDPMKALQEEKLRLDIEQQRNPRVDPGKELDLKIKQLQFEQMQQPDPMKALQIEKMKVELEQLRNPQPKPPPITEQYDEKGNPRKMMWDEKTGTYVPFGGSKADSAGLSVTLPDGTVVQQGGKPLTEAQSKDTVYATRARGALQKFEPYANSMTGLKDTMVSGVPVVGNYIKSNEYQNAEQSGREFLASILRKDTGAAVTDQEVALYGQIYFPKPGDGPEVLAQKAASRERAVKAIEAGMPPQAILAQERALSATPVAPMAPEQASPSVPAQGDGSPPAGMDPELWKHMTPEERALWN